MQVGFPPVVPGDWKSLLSLSQIAFLDCLVTSSYSGHLGQRRHGERTRRDLLKPVLQKPRPIISVYRAQSSCSFIVFTDC